ncbi:MAG: DMT family transporter [Vicinamibacterales bacterium]
MRVFLLTAATMACFAANSLLTRGALGGGRLDWASFMLIRLVTGAVTMTMLVRARGRAPADRGGWVPALTLAAYAVTFTYAYTRIGAAVGALLLFGAVQVTMIGTGLARGERPARVDWGGVVLAVAGLLALTLPGATAPDGLGAALMLAAGVCWGAYSLLGRGSRDPLAVTADNFVRASAMGLVGVAAFVSRDTFTMSGFWLAAASGAVASGIGYTLWYTVLPHLAAWRAAIAQLTVPVLTALLAAALLAEAVPTRLVVATALVLAGVGLTTIPALHRRA